MTTFPNITIWKAANFAGGKATIVGSFSRRDLGSPVYREAVIDYSPGLSALGSAVKEIALKGRPTLFFERQDSPSLARGPASVALSGRFLAQTTQG
jgi:hypothetical protein